MEFGPGFWIPLIAAAAMLLGAVVAYLLLRGAHRIARPKPSVEKGKTYACGEGAKAEEIHPDSEQFFSPIRRVLRPFYRYIQRAHTGVLSTYLLWVVVGLIILLVVILLTVR